MRELAYVQKNVRVMLGEVTGVDLAGRSVDVSCPDVGMRKVPFDYLMIATGMRPSYFGHDEFAEHAPGLKTLADAESIRARILSAYERADATDDQRHGAVDRGRRRLADHEVAGSRDGPRGPRVG